MSESRKDILLRAIQAEVGSTSFDPALFTDDVVGWSPIASISGLPDLTGLAAGRDTAFSNVVVMFRGLDEVGNKAFAEWLIEADHTGPLDLGDGAVADPDGDLVLGRGQRLRGNGRGSGLDGGSIRLG